MEEIFNLDSIDLNQLPDDTALLSSSIPTSNPYWKIPTASLLEFLSLASQFSWKSGRDLTSKSVLLSTSEDGQSLELRATDFDSYLLYSIPLETPAPKASFIFQTSSLIKILKLSSKTTVIAWEPNSEGVNIPSILFSSQWVELSPLSLNSSSFLCLDPIQPSLGNLDLSSIPKFSSIASSATLPKDRLIHIHPTLTEVSYLWSTLQSPSTSPISFDLSSRETLLLKYLDSKPSISLTTSDIPRIVLSDSHITLWLIYRKPDPDESFPITPPSFSLTIDPSSILRLCQLSEVFPTSSGLLSFQFSNSEFSIIFSTSTKSTTFSIPYTQVGDSIPNLNPSVFQSKILKILLKPIQSSPIQLSWTEEHLYLSSPTFSVVSSWES